MTTTAHQNVDVLILGAGINGCGIARELSQRGRSVLVLDKQSIGSGTSSKSSRLIHGGLRYLETFHLELVHEALNDRQELLRLYPQLVKLKTFYLPVYKSCPRPAWMIWFGLKLYDLLSGKHGSRYSRRIDKKLFLDHTPALRSVGLKSVFQYYDGKTNDLDLTRRVADDARQNGTIILENTTVTAIRSHPKKWTLETNNGTFQAPTLINATGPWIDEVNQRFDLPAQYHIRPISGIHIILKGLLTHDCLFMQTTGKRIFFIIPEPESNQTIIGTTEREETGPIDKVQIQEEDIEYLLYNINQYLRPEFQVQQSDINDTYIGVRPLIARDDNPTDLSREYALDLHRLEKTRLLHVFGGKLTTFLSLARKAADLLE